MRALRYDRYGNADVLRVVDVAAPECAPGRFRIRVRAVGLNPLDWKLRAGHLSLLPMFERPPRGVGCDFAGDIVGIGGGDARYHVGQRVFGSLPAFERQGALAELICVGPDHFAALPDALDYAAAAALPVAGGTAVQALEDHAALRAGQLLLVTGAAGGVGHFAIQLGKHLGAVVTGVCGPGNVEFVRSLGADSVVDYTRDDPFLGDGRYDVIFDAASSSDYFSVRARLADDGVYVNTSGSGAAVARTVAASVLTRLTSRQRVVALALRNDARMLERVARHAAAGVLRPHIARSIDLDAVAEAQRAMERGHGRGKVVVVVG